MALLTLALLVAAVGYASVHYEAEMLAAASWVHDWIGFPGLMAILFMSDAVITPIPPDALLVVISKSELHENWAWLIAFTGCLSALAGCAGWALGRSAGRTRAARWLLRRRGQRVQALVQRHGKWAVALGAVTPIPFSITCWFAGIFEMRFRTFAPMTLLRLPRFFVYYVAIAYGDAVLRALGQ
ncbi:MAG: VTT domain-containing protein [Polyangiaceae bacterium]